MADAIPVIFQNNEVDEELKAFAVKCAEDSQDNKKSK
jgi:hypothetical protein